MIIIKKIIIVIIKESGLPVAQVGAMSLKPKLKQGINEKTSLCHYTRGHHNEDMMRS